MRRARHEAEGVSRSRLQRSLPDRVARLQAWRSRPASLPRGAWTIGGRLLSAGEAARRASAVPSCMRVTLFSHACAHARIAARMPQRGIDLPMYLHMCSRPTRLPGIPALSRRRPCTQAELSWTGARSRAPRSGRARARMFAGPISLAARSTCVGLQTGLLAQWIRRRPPEPEIPGSSPGRVMYACVMSASTIVRRDMRRSCTP